MDKRSILEITNISLWLLLALFIYLSWIVIRPYVEYIVLGIIIAIITYPLYKKLLKVVKNKYVAAVLITFLVFVIAIVPLYYLITLVIQESNNIYFGIDALSVVSDKLEPFLGKRIPFDNAGVYLVEFVRNMFGGTNIIKNITDTLVGMLLALLLIIYTLVEGDKLYEWLKKYLPLKRSHRIRFLKEIELLVKGFMYGQFLAALFQGLALALGFYIFKVPNAFFWGFIAFILALIPFVGAPFIWVPASIFLLIEGAIIRAILLFLWGVIVISNIDNVVRIYVMRNTAKIHEAILIIGLLGGIKVFGFIGILLGPLILAIFILLITFYVEEYGEVLNRQ